MSRTKIKFCKKCKVLLNKNNSYKRASTCFCKEHYKELVKTYRHSRKGKKVRKEYQKSEKGKKALNKATNKMREKYPEKWRARALLRYAVKIGTIIKTPCIICGNIKTEGHHEDYSKPLEVIWFCVKHHKQYHRKIN